MKKFSKIRKWTALVLAVMLVLGSNSMTKTFAATQVYSENTYTKPLGNAEVECTVYAYFNYMYGTFVEVDYCNFYLSASKVEDYKILADGCYTGGSSTAEVYAVTYLDIWDRDGYWCYDSCSVAVYCDVYGNT